MKLSEITRILAEASLPTVSRDQLLELAGTQAGKQFQAALLGFAGGDRQRRDEIEATVRILDPSVRDTLRRLGSTSTVDQVVAAACREQRRLFDAVDSAAQGGVRMASARRYLVGLGLLPALPVLPAAALAASPAAVPAAALAIPPYYSLKIFGTGAALCIAEARTRATNEYSINVEGSLALAGPGPKAFDWPNKIVVQLTVQECYQLLALFENRVSSVKFDGHGVRHDKSLQGENQGTHYFVKLIQRGRPVVAVQVRPVDVIRPISLLYRQLQLNEPHLRIEDLRAMVERMASMTKA